jgi:hypothetical protein
MCECEHSRDERDDSQIATGPRQAQSFAEPEDAKGDDDDADTKLERVFRYSGEWTMDSDPQGDDHNRSGRRSQRGGNESRRHTPDSDHYQHYFNALNDHGLEGCGHRYKVQAIAKAGMQIRSHRIDLLTINRGFIALRLHARCSQYCFPQPRKPKHQQDHAHKNVQIIQWHADERTAG